MRCLHKNMETPLSAPAFVTLEKFTILINFNKDKDHEKQERHALAFGQFLIYFVVD